MGIQDWSASELITTPLGPLMVAYRNTRTGRPPFSSPYLHVIAGVGFYSFGFGIWYLKEWYQRRRRLLVEDYMRLHPEDFSDEGRKKYKDVVLPWRPYRT